MLEVHEVGVGGEFSQIVFDQVLASLQTFNFYLFLEFCGMTHFLQIINIYTIIQNKLHLGVVKSDSYCLSLQVCHIALNSFNIQI